MPIKFNPFTMKYEFVEKDHELVWNEFEAKYEFGYHRDTSYSPFTLRYSKKGKKLVDKFNPFTGRYEQVPEDWEIRQNPFTGEYEFGPKE